MYLSYKKPQLLQTRRQDFTWKTSLPSILLGVAITYAFFNKYEDNGVQEMILHTKKTIERANWEATNQSFGCLTRITFDDLKQLGNEDLVVSACQIEIKDFVRLSKSTHLETCVALTKVENQQRSKRALIMVSKAITNFFDRFNSIPSIFVILNMAAVTPAGTPALDEFDQNSSVDNSLSELVDKPSSQACIDDINPDVMSEKAALEKIVSFQKEARRKPPMPESEDAIQKLSDFGYTESSLGTYGQEIKWITQDGTIWIRSHTIIDCSPVYYFADVCQDRIARKIVDKWEQCPGKIFAYENEVYATVDDKIHLLDSVNQSFDSAPDSAPIPIESISRQILQTPSPVNTMSINEEFIVASYPKSQRSINITAARRVLDKIKSLEKESKESHTAKNDLDEYKENKEDQKQEVSWERIDVVHKNSESVRAQIKIAGHVLNMQISSRQVFVSAFLNLEDKGHCVFTFVWGIKNEEQAQTKDQSSDQVEEHLEAFQLLTTCSPEFLKPCIVIQGHHPRVNEYILCLQTSTGVSVRALDAIDRELASMKEHVRECVPVPGSRQNVMIFNHARKLSFAQIVHNRILISYTIGTDVDTFACQPNHPIVYQDRRDRVYYFKALDRTYQSSSRTPLPKDRDETCYLLRSFFYMVQENDDYLLGSTHVDSFQKNQVKLPFTVMVNFDSWVCLHGIGKTVLLWAANKIYTYDATDLSEHSVYEVTDGEILNVACNSYCCATYVRDEQKCKIQIYLISGQKLERVKTLSLHSFDKFDKKDRLMQFLLADDMTILLQDNYRGKFVLEDVMRESDLKEGDAGVFLVRHKGRWSLIFDSYVVFKDKSTLRIVSYSTDDMVLEHKFAHRIYQVRFDHTNRNLLVLTGYEKSQKCLLYAINLRYLQVHLIYETEGFFHDIHLDNTSILLIGNDYDYAKRLKFDELLPYSVYTEIGKIKAGKNTKLNIELSKFSTYPHLFNIIHFHSCHTKKKALGEIVADHFEFGLQRSCDGRSVLSDSIGKKDYKMIAVLLNKALNCPEVQKSLNYAHTPSEAAKIRLILQPIFDSLLSLTQMVPLEMEEVYSQLLFIRSRCKELSLTESQAEPQEDFLVDTDWIKEHKDTVAAEVTYEVTAGTTEVHLGQKNIHELMDSWVETDSEKILTSSFVKTVWEKLWLQSLPYICVQAVFYLIFVLTMSLHISYVQDNDENNTANGVFMPMLIGLTAVTSVYNFSEILLEQRKYVRDYWNLIDTLANTLSIIYLFQWYSDSEENDRLQILAWANLFAWLRLSGYFRLVKPTRYLMRMIFYIIQNSIPFITILLFYVFASLFSLMAFSPGDRVVDYWEIAYRLVYADFDDAEYNTTDSYRVFFFAITLFMSLILLNMLIALMGDAVDYVQSTSEKENVRERLVLILEVSKFLTGLHGKLEERHYIHLVTNDRLTQDQDVTWEGKVKVLQKTMEAMEQRIMRRLDEMEKSSKSYEVGSKKDEGEEEEEGEVESEEDDEGEEAEVYTSDLEE